MSIDPIERQLGRTVVMGLGNPLMRDDGLGLAALRELQDRWNVPECVELVDAGTWGMTLLPLIEDATRLLLLDAIDIGGAPGAAVLIDRQDLPRYFATKLSPHQIDLREVLAVAELRGTLPKDTVAIGLQPGMVELGVGLSSVVTDHLHDLVAEAIGVLGRWGHECIPVIGYVNASADGVLNRPRRRNAQPLSA